MDIEPTTLFLIIAAIFLGGSLAMLMSGGKKVHKEAQLLIETRSRMNVRKNVYGEFLGERRQIMIGSDFYLIRRVGNIVICRTFNKGEMFFMRYHDYVEALQEGRIRVFYA